MGTSLDYLRLKYKLGPQNFKTKLASLPFLEIRIKLIPEIISQRYEYNVMWKK